MVTSGKNAVMRGRENDFIKLRLLIRLQTRCGQRSSFQGAWTGQDEEHEKDFALARERIDVVCARGDKRGIPGMSGAHDSRGHGLALTSGLNPVPDVAMEWAGVGGLRSVQTVRDSRHLTRTEKTVMILSLLNRH